MVRVDRIVRTNVDPLARRVLRERAPAPRRDQHLRRCRANQLESKRETFRPERLAGAICVAGIRQPELRVGS
jgi:hypothetical protein